MSSKKYKNKTCVYCGNQNASSTSDHVFAKEFFLIDKRDNLPQVPSCTECNNQKSKLEHELTAVLPFGGQHRDARENLSSMVPKRLNKNKPLYNKLKSGKARALFKTESGRLEESTSIPADHDKLKTLIELIVRGLCKYHMDVQLLPGYQIEVKFTDENGVKHFDGIMSRNCFNNHIEVNLGNGTVKYKGVRGIEDPNVTVWLIKFYGGIQLGDDMGRRISMFVALTTPSA
jgi:hypothetical protein